MLRLRTHRLALFGTIFAALLCLLTPLSAVAQESGTPTTNPTETTISNSERDIFIGKRDGEMARWTLLGGGTLIALVLGATLITFWSQVKRQGGSDGLKLNAFLGVQSGEVIIAIAVLTVAAVLGIIEHLNREAVATIIGGITGAFFSARRDAAQRSRGDSDAHLGPSAGPTEGKLPEPPRVEPKNAPPSLGSESQP